MKQVTYTSIFLVTLMLVSVGAQAELKIGVVNMQKAIESTSAGKNAKKQLKKEFDKRKNEMKKKEDDLKKMQEDFVKKKLVLSDKVRRQKQQSLQEEMLKYREMLSRNQMEISKKERQLVGPIAEKLSKLIQKLGKDEKYTLIMQRSEQVQNLLFVDGAIDLTDKVVKAFEKNK